MSKLDKKQSTDDLLKGMNQEEAKKLRIHELIKFALITPALILGIGYGSSIIAGILLVFVLLVYYFFSHILTGKLPAVELGSLLGALIIVSSSVILLCAFVVGAIYGTKKARNLYKIQRHLRKMKPPLDELLPHMSEAETKKLRNKDLIKLILIAPPLILGIAFGSGPIAGIIVVFLSLMYFSISTAFTENTDSFQVGWSFSSLIFALRMVILLGGFVAIGIYAVSKVLNLRKIKRHLSTLRRT